MSGRFQRLEFGTEAATDEHAAQAPLHVVPGLAIRTAREVLSDAVELDRRESWEGALRLYTHALGEDRGLVQAWVGQVRMLVELGEYPEAALWSDKALELFRGEGDLLAAKGLAALRDRNPGGAATLSDAATAAPGSSAFRWLARGEVLLASGKERSRDCFDRAVRESEAAWAAAAEVARVCCRYGHPATAIEFASRATAQHPRHPVPWLALGRAERGLGLSARARVSLRRSLELDSTCGAAKAELRLAETTGAMGSLLRRVGSVFRGGVK